jgi:phosphoenolpyruvate---glycerone phosphotransferase subunit DhaL
MALDIASLSVAVARAHAAMASLEQPLNEADAKLGDGDTGSMLARVFDRLSEVDLKGQSELGGAFRALAAASMAATGSSLGTLFGTGLMAAGRETKGLAELDWSRLSPMLAAARDAMLARGGAKLGDKTVLDALDAVATASQDLAEPSAIAAAATRAGQETLDRFRPIASSIGRARMFAERSVGLDDPGMLAFVRLSEAVAGEHQTPTSR